MNRPARSDAIAANVLPHSIEAEQSVLGGLMLDNAAWAEASSLQSVDFFDPSHGAIYAAIGTMIRADEPADVITVFERLQRLKMVDQVGGLSYLNALAMSVPSSTNMARYVQIVKDKAAHRTLLRTLATDDSRLALEAVRQVVERMRETTTISAERLDVGHAFGQTPPALDYVLPGLLAGTVGAIVSPGGAGKSMAALELAALVGAGVDLLGLDARLPTGRVSLMLAEDPPDALSHRLHAIGLHLDSTQRQRVAAAVRILPLLGQSVDIMRDNWFTYFCREAEGARLVVFDTLRRIHRLEENDSSDMAELVGRLELLARTVGCTIVFLHHAAKTAALNGQGGMQQASRGSSVLVDNIRWQMFLAGMSKNEAKEQGVDEAMSGYFVRCGVSKQNFGPPIRDIWLERSEGGVLLPVDFAVGRELKKGAKTSPSASRRAGSANLIGEEW